MKRKGIFAKKDMSQDNGYYDDSTQKWLPVNDIKNGVVVLKDERYIKVLEVLPVNFYLKSETEQQNIIYYFASYLKVAPDAMQIRVLTQKADIGEYLERMQSFMEAEPNEICIEMMANEMSYIAGLVYNVAVKKRFFVVFEYTQRHFDRTPSFADIVRNLEDEEDKARRYLAQCGLEVMAISDDAFLINLFYSIINKNTSKSVKPGNITFGMFDEVHTFEGGVDHE